MINNYCSRKNKEQFQELCGITATSSKWMLHHSVFTNSFVESNDRLTAASLNKPEQVYYLSRNIKLTNNFVRQANCLKKTNHDFNN